MRRNKAYIREIYVVFFLILIVCFNLFFLFPVLNREIAGFERSGVTGVISEKDAYAVRDGAAGNDIDSKILIISENDDSSLVISNPSGDNSGLFDAETGNYIIFTILARNISSTDFPRGTVSVRWRYAKDGGSDYGASEVEKFQIFVDGLVHDYHVNIGENPQWDTSEEISEIKIELPEVEGVSIEIKEISMRERLAAPVDSYVNRFFRNNFNIREINRFFIPSYLGFMMLCFFIYSLKLVSKKVITGKVAFSFAVIILVIFSFYYMKNEIFTVKSYFDSYRKYIAEGDFENTYLGFYDFERFIMWLDENTPEGGNMIVLVQGEQIYIMSEMAYNLYPKDIKFINISGKSLAGIEADIDAVIRDSGKKYSYLVSLAKEDFIDRDLSMIAGDGLDGDPEEVKDAIKHMQDKYMLEKNYREAGGFLYRIAY